ncbi:MAG: flagellar hook-length control protein FliK [Thermodesulfobacteriota bacterium]
MEKTNMELAFKLVGPKGYAGQSQNKRAEGNEAFFPLFFHSISSRPAASSYGQTRFSAKEPPMNKGSFYLESLRKALLAQGKPMNQVYVKDEDVFLLAKLLLHCGYSQENVNKLLEELTGGNSQGQINLSTFFQKVAELAPLDQDQSKDTVIEPSAIPYLESALRDLGLSLAEIDAVFGAAKVEVGGLSLNRFLTKLGLTGNAGVGAETLENEKFINKPTSSQYVSAGAQHTEHVKGITVRDLIAALKHTAGGKGPERELPPAVQAAINHMEECISQGSLIQNAKRFENQSRMGSFTERGHQSIQVLLAGLDKGGQIPPSVKAIIEQIVNQASVYQENGKTPPSGLSFLRPEAANAVSKSIHGEKSSSFSEERLMAVSKNNSSIAGRETDRSKEATVQSKRLRIVSNISGRGTDTGIHEEHLVAKPQSRMVSMGQNGEVVPFSDAASTDAQHQESSKSVLPPHVMGQVSKQISRSLLSADRVIRLQLKPPELGALKIEMDLKDNILKLGVVAENSAVRELLLSNVHELREALIDQGVKLDRLDVHIHSNMNNEMAGSHEGNAGRHNGMKEMDEATVKEDHEHEASLAGPWYMDENGHVVDLVA